MACGGADRAHAAEVSQRPAVHGMVSAVKRMQRTDACTAACAHACPYMPKCPCRPTACRAEPTSFAFCASVCMLLCRWLRYYLAHDSEGPTKGVWWEHVAPATALQLREHAAAQGGCGPLDLHSLGHHVSFSDDRSAPMQALSVSIGKPGGGNSGAVLPPCSNSGSAAVAAMQSSYAAHAWILANLKHFPLLAASVAGQGKGR